MKFKVIRSEHARSDEIILEASSLDELARQLGQKTGQSEPTLGFSEDELTGGLGDDGGLL